MNHKKKHFLVSMAILLFLLIITIFINYIFEIPSSFMIDKIGSKYTFVDSYTHEKTEVSLFVLILKMVTFILLLGAALNGVIRMSIFIIDIVKSKKKEIFH